MRQKHDSIDSLTVAQCFQSYRRHHCKVESYLFFLGNEHSEADTAEAVQSYEEQEQDYC